MAMVTRHFVVVLLAAALAAGCGHVLVCARQGGPAWRQYDSHHFAVTTDLSPPRARRLVAELERTYRIFVDATGWRFPGRGEPPRRMRVVVFSRRADYDAVGPAHSDGFYRPETLDAESAVVIDNDGSHAPGEVFMHELTHRLVRYYVPNLPLGLNEGLAEYFSTFDIRSDVVALGLPPRRFAYLNDTMLPSVDTLFSAESLDGLSPAQKDAFYRGGWFLVHTMAKYYPQELGGMLGRLADGESIREAFTDAFGGTAWAMLGSRYVSVVSAAYQPGGFSVPTWRKPYQPPAQVEGVTDEHDLGDGALHLLWADLQRGRRDIAPQVTLAAAHGGDSAELAYMRALVDLDRKDVGAAERDLRAAVDGRPDEERYHLTLARVRMLGLGADSKQALAAMAPEMEWLDAHAQLPDARAIVGLYYAMRGDFATARAQGQRVLGVDPTNANGYLVLAIVAEETGDLDGAIADAERALRLTPEGASHKPAQLLLATLYARRRGPLRLNPPKLLR
jgi:tetratricopeptide (TPR) repeat protein